MRSERSRVLLITPQRRSSYSGSKMGTDGSISIPCGWREWRRLRALRQKQKGWSERGIAAALGVREETVNRWTARARDGGPEALSAHPRSGHPPELSDAQARLILGSSGSDPKPTILCRAQNTVSTIDAGLDVTAIPDRVGDETHVPILPRTRVCRNYAAIRSGIRTRPHSPTAKREPIVSPGREADQHCRYSAPLPRVSRCSSRCLESRAGQILVTPPKCGGALPWAADTNRHPPDPGVADAENQTATAVHSGATTARRVRRGPVFPTAHERAAGRRPPAGRRVRAGKGPCWWNPEA